MLLDAYKGTNMSVKLQLQNKIINGAFDFWQRGTSFAAATAFQYYPDRWRYAKNGTMVHTIARSTDVPSDSSSQYSLLVDCTTAQASLGAGNYSLFEHKIEGNFLRSFKDKKMVLKFKVKATKIGTYSVGFTNAAANRSLVLEYPVAQSDTWETKTLRFQHDSTGTWNYDTSMGLSIIWNLANGGTVGTSTIGTWTNSGSFASSNQVNAVDNVANNFQLSDVCLVEDNEGATREPDFVYAGRDYFEELQLCQRYYEKSYNLDVNPGTVTSVGVVYEVTGASGAVFFTCPYVEKRVTPNVDPYNPITGVINNARTGGTNSAATTPQVSTNSAIIQSSSGAAGSNCLVHFVADAEL
jgi:hypothetical protein